MTEAEKERAMIVAYLRSNPGVFVNIPSPNDGPFKQQDKTIQEVRRIDADAIERGEHRKPSN